MPSGALKTQTADRITSVPGVVHIWEHLYAKSPQSLRALLKALRANSYEVKDTRNDTRIDKTPAEVRERDGWHLWYAHLSGHVLQRKAKCGSCHGLISYAGVRTHGHKCEKCGKVTYLEFVRGTSVNFRFPEDERIFYQEWHLVVHSYDARTKRLRFFANPNDVGKPYDKAAMEKMMKLLTKQLKTHPNAFKREVVGGIEVLSTPYEVFTGLRREQKPEIVITQVWGGKVNYRDVKVFRGKVLDEHAELPVPESYYIYEAWRWAPLQPSPTLHERILEAGGVVSDMGYYSQDGREVVREGNIGAMHTFVRNFTTLDIEAWDRMVAAAPKSGPEFIVAVAEFCHPNAIIENRANAGNFLVAMGKAAEGIPLTAAEIAAADRALIEDKATGEFVGQIVAEANARRLERINKGGR